MKKALRLLILFTTFYATTTYSQTCVRDSNLYITGQLFSPAPYSPDSPTYNLKLACIDESYGQSVSINVPGTFTFSGVTVGVTNISIATSNAIGGFPVGLTYLCDPPNCVFNANTLGCIHLYGTPSPSNAAPDTLDLTITATVQSAFGPFPVQFPGNPNTPDDYYYMILRPQGQCTSRATDLGSPFSDVRAMPNPVGQQTTIEAISTQTGAFQFEVFDLPGNRIHSQTVHLFEGANQFIYDASKLPAGTYLYTLGNTGSKSVRRMVKL